MKKTNCLHILRFVFFIFAAVEVVALSSSVILPLLKFQCVRDVCSCSSVRGAVCFGAVHSMVHSMVCIRHLFFMSMSVSAPLWIEMWIPTQGDTWCSTRTQAKHAVPLLVGVCVCQSNFHLGVKIATFREQGVRYWRSSRRAWVDDICQITLEIRTTVAQIRPASNALLL